VEKYIFIFIPLFSIYDFMDVAVDVKNKMKKKHL
jgi:hypothetical protein